MITITRNIPKAMLAAAIVFAFSAGAAIAQSAPSQARPQPQAGGQMDQNGDGKISADEAKWMTAKSIAKIDTNKDGVITADELKAEEERIRNLERQRQLASIDSNHDGKVTTTEFAAMDAEHFKQMDRNKDGFITPDETRPPGQ
jgi:hypothetical protein